jgi:hypothetical protein
MHLKFMQQFLDWPPCSGVSLRGLGDEPGFRRCPQLRIRLLFFIAPPHAISSAIPALRDGLPHP